MNEVDEKGILNNLKKELKKKRMKLERKLKTDKSKESNFDRIYLLIPSLFITFFLYVFITSYNPSLLDEFSPPFSIARVCGIRKRKQRFRLRVNRFVLNGRQYLKRLVCFEVKK